jgi:hypothetical protein
VTGTAAIVGSTLGLRGAGLIAQILKAADAVGDETHFGAGRLNSYHAVTRHDLKGTQ